MQLTGEQIRKYALKFYANNKDNVWLRDGAKLTDAEAVEQYGLDRVVSFYQEIQQIMQKKTAELSKEIVKKAQEKARQRLQRLFEKYPEYRDVELPENWAVKHAELSELHKSITVDYLFTFDSGTIDSLAENLLIPDMEEYFLIYVWQKDNRQEAIAKYNQKPEHRHYQNSFYQAAYIEGFLASRIESCVNCVKALDIQKLADIINDAGKQTAAFLEQCRIFYRWFSNIDFDNEKEYYRKFNEFWDYYGLPDLYI